MFISLKPFAALLLFCASCASTPAARQAPDAPAAPEQEAPDALPADVRSAMQAAEPGPEHAMLAKLAGDWDLQMKMWMAPNTPPIVASSKVKNEMVLGGRFLRAHSKGEMNLGGVTLTVESIGMMGFDRRNGVFTSVGFDTMGTYYVTAAGEQDPETGVITMAGSDHDRRTNMTQTYKFVMRVIDDDHYIIDLYFTNPEMTHGQDEFRLVEMSHTRS